MTFCKVLKEEKRGADTITAYEKVEKFSAAKSYEICVSRNGIAYHVEQTAKTTWKRKFNQLMNE